ncbi:MAG TPA: C45 family peptidase [Paracoccaceae bacterium]
MKQLVLNGSSYSRGREQAASAMAAQVRAATVARVEQARADGLFDAEAMGFLAAQHAFHTQHSPEGMAELLGIAEGFGLAEPDLFAHLHLGTLRDRKGGAKLVDGCSAWAVADGPDGPMLAKNRDFSGQHLGIQTVAHHTGPDIATGGLLCVGSLGSPGAYSSGINARGLALADTQVAVATHRVGWLRYFLMTRLLARCATVTEALALLRAVPHTGGGTLIMADKSGDLAAVELGAARVTVTRGTPVWRTNHYVTSELADDTLPPATDSIAANSRLRFDFLSRTLPTRVWSRASAARLMATHDDHMHPAAPICQHAVADGAQTISSAVYSCNLQQLEFCEGNPCIGNWQTIPLPA